VELLLKEETTHCRSKSPFGGARHARICRQLFLLLDRCLACPPRSFVRYSPVTDCPSLSWYIFTLADLVSTPESESLIYDRRKLIWVGN
jgi:hypothetical protein